MQQFQIMKQVVLARKRSNQSHLSLFFIRKQVTGHVFFLVYDAVNGAPSLGHPSLAGMDDETVDGHWRN